MTTLSLSQFLPYRLSILSNRLSDAISGAYRARFGLSITQWRIIAVLAEYGEMSARDIAKATETDKVAVSRAVQHLTHRGLIKLSRSEDDGRLRIVRLTQEGRTIFDEVAPLARKFQTDLMEGMAEEDRAALDRLITQLNDRLGAIEGESQH